MRDEIENELSEYQKHLRWLFRSMVSMARFAGKDEEIVPDSQGVNSSPTFTRCELCHVDLVGPTHSTLVNKTTGEVLRMGSKCSVRWKMILHFVKTPWLLADHVASGELRRILADQAPDD